MTTAPQPTPQPQPQSQQQQPATPTVTAAFGSNPEYFSCRMYEQRFPEVDDLVVVLIKRIADMGVYVSLLEYNNIEGMILLSEISRRRIRSINKLIRVGKQEVVVVLRVDKEKGYIDLSKRRVSPQEIAKCEDKYNKAKVVHSIMRHFAELRRKPLEELYKMYTWPLSKAHPQLCDAFKQAVTDGTKVWDSAGVAVADRAELEELVTLIRKRMTPQPTKIRADIEVTCFQYEGIDSIRAALTAGERCGTEQSPISVKLVAPPAFVMFASALDKQDGIRLLTAAIEAIRGEITRRGGQLTVKQAPRSISDREETEFAEMLENMEADGQAAEDEDESDESDESGDEEGDGKPTKPAAAAAAAKDDEGDDADDGDEEKPAQGQLRRVPDVPSK